jgi:hypothetical protein
MFDSNQCVVVDKRIIVFWAEGVLRAFQKSIMAPRQGEPQDITHRTHSQPLRASQQASEHQYMRAGLAHALVQSINELAAEMGRG